MRAALLLVATIGFPLAAQTQVPSPAQAIRTGAFQEPDLTESSGVVRSPSQPNLLFTINDSGNRPEIFATDSTGRPIGRWLVPGTSNRDWEALSLGPCPAGSCFYIGDIGDNQEKQTEVVIYRVRVPAIEVFRGVARKTPPNLDSAIVRYPDGAHDAEALWVGDAGEAYIVSKGRSGGVKLYRVPANAFGARQPATVALLQTLPIDPLVTDAARSPDGRRIAIRTYNLIHFFSVIGGGRLSDSYTSCSVANLEPQGEGITWLDDRRLLLTSESSRAGAGPIHIVTCGR